MDTKTIIGVVLAVIVLGGGGWYIATHPSAKNTDAPVVSNTASNSPSNGTFADLMAKTGSWQCEVSAEQTQSSSKGTVFLSDGKIRGDFTATVMEKTIGAHILNIDGFMYSWSDMLPQGVKVKVVAASGTGGGQGIDPSTKVQYSCAPWAVDATKFAVPSDIKFFEVPTK